MSAPQRSIRVLTADTQPLFQDSLRRAIEQRPRFELVAQVGDDQALLAELEDAAPDVALIDDSLLEPERVGALATRVVLLAGAPDATRAFDAVERGAAGYLTRDGDAEALCDALACAAAGETVLDPRLQTGIAREVRLRAGNGRPVLSQREHEVLGLIATGRSAQEIGSRLHVSKGTVKTHILHLYGKLGVSERAAAVATAMRQGLLE